MIIVLITKGTTHALLQTSGRVSGMEAKLAGLQQALLHTFTVSIIVLSGLCLDHQGYDTCMTTDQWEGEWHGGSAGRDATSSVAHQEGDERQAARGTRQSEASREDCQGRPQALNSLTSSALTHAAHQQGVEWQAAGCTRQPETSTEDCQGMRLALTTLSSAVLATQL